MSGTVVYTLALCDGYYYVGKTNNLNRRLDEHRNHAPNTPEWTHIHPVVGILSEQPDVPGEFTEHIQTLRMMLQFGIDRVRGDVYCEVNLSDEKIGSLEEILASNEGVCYLCHEKGHFVADCPIMNYGCERCGRENHTVEQCYATTDVDGHWIQ